MIARLHNNSLEVRVDLGNTGNNWPNCPGQTQPGFPWLSFGRSTWQAAADWAFSNGATSLIFSGPKTEVDPKSVISAR